MTVLVRRHEEEGLRFSGIEAFLLDEYVGRAAARPADRPYDRHAARHTPVGRGY